MRTILIRVNGNVYTAVVYEDGRCVLDTGEEYSLTTEQLEQLADLSERSDRIAALEESGREILPIADQTQMSPPEEDLNEPEPEEEQSAAAGQAPAEKTVNIGKLDKEALEIEDLEAYERNLEAVRRKRENTAKLICLILLVILLLCVVFLWLLNSGTLDPILRQIAAAQPAEVTNGL